MLKLSSVDREMLSSASAYNQGQASLDFASRLYGIDVPVLIGHDASAGS